MIWRIFAVVLASVAVAVGLLALSPGGGEALPGDSYLFFTGLNDGYVEVADDPALEPQDALTWETWVYLSSYGSWNGNTSCPSLIGKGYVTSHWVGICSGEIRWYPGIGGSQDSTGTVPLDAWTHVAVTYDEATVKFYINGVLDSEFGFVGTLGDNANTLRFGSDADWPYPPRGGLDEIRLWNVVRTEAEIAGPMNTTIVAPEGGLVGVWNFDDDAMADVGGFGGTIVVDAEIRTGAVPTPAPTPEPTPEPSETPVPSETEVPSETPTPAPGNPQIWADANCDGGVDPVDSLAVLRYDAGLSVNQEPDCPDLGGTVGVAGGGVARVGSAAGAAQTGGYLRFTGPGSGYVQVAHDPALNPAAALTLEAWVYLESYVYYGTAVGDVCASLIGKDYQESYWFGKSCEDNGLAGYAEGGNYNSGTADLPLGVWVHVALTNDGAEMKFYINGVLAATEAGGGPPTASLAELRIGNDVSWDQSPVGRMDEVRIWSVARTEAEIAGAMNTQIDSPMAGLVAAWNFEGSAEADVGGFGGTLVDDVVIEGAAVTESPTATPAPTDTPTASATASPEPSDTPEPGTDLEWGDANCDGGVDPVDSLAILRSDAGLEVNQEPGCPAIGQSVEVTIPT